MDQDLRTLERSTIRSTEAFFAVLLNGDVEARAGWEKVTLVGFLGHEGCLVAQGRDHYFLARVHTIAALAELPGVALILDLRTLTIVKPTFVTWYLYDFEEGWTELTDRKDKRDERFSEPYRPLEKFCWRPADFRGPMHEELDRCHGRYKEARARIEAQSSARFPAT